MKLLLFTSYRGWSHGRKWLTALAQRHDVHVATFKDFGDRIPGVTIHAILGPAAAPSATTGQGSGSHLDSSPWITLRIGIKFARQLGQLIDELQPDLVHAHQTVPFGWYALRAVRASTRKPRLVVSAWGTDVLAYPERYPLYRWINRRVLAGADQVTATGAFLRDAAYRWTARRDITLVPFGVDTSLFARKAGAPSAAATFGIAKQLKATVYGIELAVEALARARLLGADVALELAGSGPARAALEQLAHERHIAAHVRFLGEVPQHELPAVMQRWDAYLMPSQQESFGVAALEAEAIGLPILAARTGGIPEVVREGVTARFVEPLTAHALADAMVALQRGSSLLQSAWDEGPRWVHEHYEWSTCVRQMEEVYAS